jgi:prepilin-type N-terminal cleavage/methylation domain-containing protein
VKLLLNKKSKAFGLVEVLIAIAISGVIMLAVVNVAARGLRLVRENEIRDTASAVMLRSLEIARSPVDFNFNEIVPETGRTSFTVNYEEGAVTLSEESFGDPNGITDCESGSRYQVDLADNLLICNQVIISLSNSRQIDSTTRELTYQVESVVVYDFIGQDVQDSLISYRTEIVDDN